MKISLNELRKIVRQTIAEAQSPEMDYVDCNSSDNRVFSLDLWSCSFS